MSHYQIFYQTTVKLLSLKSPLTVKRVLSTPQEFLGWFKLQSFAVIQPDDFKNLHRDLYEFFYKTCPKLRIFE
jgi:hypothetical protein